MRVKKEIRIIGWDDAPFTFSDKRTLLIGVICRGGGWVDGVLTAKIDVDGLDATERIAESIKRSGHREQLRMIMLNGITFGGFNLVDMQVLYKATGLPVISIIRSRPNLESIRKALKKSPDFERKWTMVQGAPRVEKTEIKSRVIKQKNKSIYYQKIGVDKGAAEEAIRVSCTRSLVPEPLRVAHIIGSGLKGNRW